MKKIIFGTLLITFWSLPIHASGDETNLSVNLPAVLQAIQNRSPYIKGAVSRMAETKVGLNEVRSLNWPKLSIRSSVTRGDDPVYVFGSLLEQHQFGPQNFAVSSLNNPDYLTNYKNALVIGVPVFTGLELQSSTKMAKIQSDQSQVQWEGAIQQARLQGIELYLQLLLNRDLLRIANDRIESSRDEVENARKLNARGLVLGSDFYAAQAILSGLETQKFQIGKNLDASRDSLALLTGNQISENDVKGILSSANYLLESDQELVSKALSHRTDLRQIDSQVSLADLAARQSRRSFWPKVEAYAALETNTEDFKSNPSTRMIGLRSDFPIGDPSYFPRKEKARAQMDEAVSYKNSAEDQARLEIISAQKRLQGAIASLPKAKETFEKAQKSLELFRPLYREGHQSIIEVLRAEEGLMRAESMYVEIIYQVHSQFAHLQYAAGTLDESAVNKMCEQLGAR